MSLFDINTSGMQSLITTTYNLLCECNLGQLQSIWIHNYIWVWIAMPVWKGGQRLNHGIIHTFLHTFSHLSLLWYPFKISCDVNISHLYFVTLFLILLFLSSVSELVMSAGHFMDNIFLILPLASFPFISLCPNHLGSEDGFPMHVHVNTPLNVFIKYYK